MFVPDWSSLGQESNNPTEDNNETITTDLASNGDNPHNDTVELIHDCTTGVTTVTSDEEEDGINQCAMWTSTSPQQEEGYSDDNAAASATYSDTNHVLSSFGGGDIWTTEGFSFESPLKDLLDSNVYSLVDLLEQDELLQELRGCEDRLISYFSKPEVVAGLVECIICEVPYVNEERGKERWCGEEKERRERIAAEKQGGMNINDISQLNGSIDTDNNTGPNSSCDPTILDTTNEIEATWNSPFKNPQLVSSKHEATTENQLSLEEEYDLRYFRYPYMACEVLCSDVGDTLDVLVNGCVQDLTIDDDDDSLLNGSNGVTLEESKSQEKEELYDNIDVSLDTLNGNSSSELNNHRSQQLNPPPTPRNQPLQNRRILDLLFSVLVDTPPSSLDDRRAGYFEKLLIILFRKYSQTMSDYMNTPLIEINMSKAKIHRTSIIESDTNNGVDDSADVPLMPPSMDSAGTEDESQLVSSSLRPLLSPIKTQLPVSDNPCVNAPPMLMCALFDNLHSHSIMHVVQRLLLPSAARQQQKPKEINAKSNEDTGSCSPNSDMNVRFMNAISEMNNAADQNHNDDEEGIADDDIDNPIDHLFQCDWSEHPQHALELLLSRLEGQVRQPYLMKYNFPTGYDESLLQAENGADSSNGEIYDAKMSCAQHASEILIGIIQNSALDSAAIVALSSEPFLSQIIQMSSFSSGSKKMQTLVPYESTMTCAMSVLEHLILQLGGYGAVTVPAASGSSTENGKSSPSLMKEIDTSFSLTELGPHTPVASPAPLDVNPTVATTATLLSHLPNLLEDFSSLLVHPDAKSWSTPVQYTHNQSQPILGTIRIRIIRLVESLVLLGDPVADLLIQQSDCLECCLNLFWKFEWCSMLHQSVTNFVVHILEAGDDRAGLQDYLIVRCQLLERVLNSFTSDASPKNELNQRREIEGKKTNDDALVMAMKTMYTNHVASSLESLDGSESDNDNSCRGRLVDVDENEAVALVSEDDIESAIEKEEQDNQAMNTSLNSSSTPEESAISDAPANDNQLSYRRGYMGHVIIISQALVKASNITSHNNITHNNQSEKSQENGLWQVDDLLQNAIMTTEFEHCAVHLLSEESPPSSKKRLDTSPTRIGDNDLPMSPISEAPCSLNDVESIAQSPFDCQPGEDLHDDVSHLQMAIRQHPLAERWTSFVSTTLACEISLQSSPLGGQHMNKDSAASVSSDSKNGFASIINDEPDSDFLGHKGVFGIIDGDFDMNEAEIDIAAEMMESLTFNSNSKDPQTNGNNGMTNGTLTGNEGSNGHARNIGNFGSLIQSSSCSTESKGYVYDDPLGCVCQFENGDSSDEEDTDFAPKAGDKVIEKKSLSKSNSTDDEDLAPPVLDLFTGNFAVNFTNDQSEPSTEQVSSPDITWANFANFDDIAFEEEATTLSATAKNV